MKLHNDSKGRSVRSTDPLHGRTPTGLAEPDRGDASWRYTDHSCLPDISSKHGLRVAGWKQHDSIRTQTVAEAYDGMTGRDCLMRCSDWPFGVGYYGDSGRFGVATMGCSFLPWDHGQQYLLPPDLRDWLPADHEVCGLCWRRPAC